MKAGMKKAVGNSRVEYGIAMLVCAIVSFFFLLNSPLHPWNGTEPATDSSVFKAIAFMMEKGYMPYRDSFDHKGPLLYLINWLGNQISYFRGVWVIEFIVVTFTFFMLYRIARIRTGISSSCLTVLMAGTLLFGYFDGGNLTEEYAMPCIAVGIYIFLKYLLENKISAWRIGVSGLAMAAVLLLRPNMIAVWVVFCIAIFVKTIVAKDWKTLGRFVLGFLAGAAVLIVPVMIWLLVNGALGDCIQAYIVFNMKYSSAEGGMSPFSDKWRVFFEFMGTTVYLIAFAGNLFHLKKDKFVNITYAVYMVIGVVLISMSGMSFGHYGMTLIPVVIYPISLIFADLEQIARTDSGRVLRMLAVLCVSIGIIVPGWIGLVKEVPAYYEQRNEKGISDVFNQVRAVIEQYTTEDDKISVRGNQDFFYVYAKRMHATKYSYQHPIGAVMPEIMDEYLEQMQEELPVLVVVQHEGFYDERTRDFLDRNQYRFIWGQNGTIEAGGVMIFYREK